MTTSILSDVPTSSTAPCRLASDVCTIENTRPGDFVTGEPPRYYDGTPVKGWPDAHYVRTVQRVALIAGVPSARLRNPHARPGYRFQWESLCRLRHVAGVAS